MAGQRQQDIASVITLGAPFRGTVAHSSILHAAETVRQRILKKHGTAVLPACYTGHCTCDFVDSLQRSVPAKVLETAVYTPDDGVVDWRYCRTGNPEADFQVSGTHIGLVFNSSVYAIIANRLAQTHCAQDKQKAKRAVVCSPGGVGFPAAATAARSKWMDCYRKMNDEGRERLNFSCDPTSARL